MFGQSVFKPSQALRRAGAGILPEAAPGKGRREEGLLTGYCFGTGLNRCPTFTGYSLSGARGHRTSTGHYCRSRTKRRRARRGPPMSAKEGGRTTFERAHQWRAKEEDARACEGGHARAPRMCRRRQSVRPWRSRVALSFWPALWPRAPERLYPVKLGQRLSPVPNQ